MIYISTDEDSISVCIAIKQSFWILHSLMINNKSEECVYEKIKHKDI